MKSILTLSMDQILIPENEMRKIANLENLEELTNSVRKYGVINPISVKQIKKDKYEIIAGVRRYLASKAAGKTDIRVTIFDLSELDNDMIKVHENLYREDVNPTDEAVFYSSLIEKHKLTKSEIAKMINKSEAYVTTRLELLSAPPEVAAAVQSEQINISVALELAKISDEQTRKYYLTLAIENGITLNTARTWRTNWEIEAGRRPVPIEPTTQQKSEIQRAIFTDTCAACRNTVQLHERRIIIVCPSCHQIITNPPLK